MKKTLLPLLILGASLSSTLAFAQSVDPVVPVVPYAPVISAQTEGSETVTITKLSKLQARGAQLIKQRVNSLNALSTQINSSKLTADQKATITAMISTQVTSLNTLGGQISSGTDATTTKGLVQSIFTNFRIYAVFIPQVKLTKRINELQNHIAKLTDVFTKVQANITAAQGKGKDVTTWQANLTAAQATVASDTTQLSTLLTQVAAMKPADYPATSKTEITSANTAIKSVVSDLNGIAKKIKNPNSKKMMKASASTSTASSTKAN